MPISGTPVPSPPTPPIGTGTGPVPVAPVVTKSYGTPIGSKMRAIQIQQSQAVAVQVPLLYLNTSGDLEPIDLAFHGFANGVVPSTPNGTTVPTRPWLSCRFMEASGFGETAAAATTQTVYDASNGIISCVIPDSIRSVPGVYQAEFGLFDGFDNLMYSDTIYLWVNRGQFGLPAGTASAGTGIGCPSMMEIRLNLRDQPEINRLIDEFEFDVADICEATTRSILYFNGAQPPLSRFYNTQNFPWRYQWLDGIASYLYEFAAGYYRRNALQHQTAGLNVNDLNREQPYLQAWQIRNERWTTWVKMKRVQLNMAEGFGEFGSPYSHYDGYRGGTW